MITSTNSNQPTATATCTVSGYDVADRQRIAQALEQVFGHLQPNNVPAMVMGHHTSAGDKTLGVGLYKPRTSDGFSVDFRLLDSPPRVTMFNTNIDLTTVSAKQLQSMADGALRATIWKALTIELPPYRD